MIKYVSDLETVMQDYIMGELCKRDNGGDSLEDALASKLTDLEGVLDVKEIDEINTMLLDENILHENAISISNGVYYQEDAFNDYVISAYDVYETLKQFKTWRELKSTE